MHYDKRTKSCLNDTGKPTEQVFDRKTTSPNKLVSLAFFRRGFKYTPFTVTVREWVILGGMFTPNPWRNDAI